MPRQYTKRQPQAIYTERARAGAKARNSLDSYVKQIVERAPELTDEHIAKLRTLLRPVPGGAAE
ncbi:hypothetical protein [Streptomyces plumbiresistens]|uniref:Uncharacterized protein n=1 Tax=Streptomyces plumbiresistens TaxID=511811 RepID=A0ABP7ST03_9ACTN